MMSPPPSPPPPLSFSRLSLSQEWFKDDFNRVILPRGVNLSGATKTPADVTSFHHVGDGEQRFFEHQTVSFVGRPFPLSEAPEHFHRLKQWGLSFLRFIVTWEAIEHLAPGQYDEEYLDYVVEVLTVAKQYGLACFVDPHQDVWSRFTGGSGAPGWTLELAGFDLRKLRENNAAIVHNTWEGDPKDFPMMIWPSNYSKLACATMFTLFFAGRTFAPNLLVEGQNIQDFLQDHYCNSIRKVAERVKDLGVVVGYDTLNEPSPGYIGIRDLRVFPENQILKNQNCPTPFQTMLLGSGYPEKVEYWERSMLGLKKAKDVVINTEKVCAWKSGRCLWAEHGVWNQETKELLRPDYFATKPDGTRWNFLADFWLPFVNKFSAVIREAHPEAFMFVEPAVNEEPPVWGENDVKGPLVYAPHWYDGLTLYNKSFAFYNVNVLEIMRGTSSVFSTLRIGDKAIERGFTDQVRTIKADGLHRVGRCPCLIGETGIPFDLDGKRSYASHDYSKQVRAMNATISAMEANLVAFTLWNYCADNSNERGDHWNGEDFSIFSKDTVSPASRPRLWKTPSQAELSSASQDAKAADAAPPAEAVSDTWKGLASASNLLAMLVGMNPGALPLPPQNQLNFDAGGRALPAVIRPYAMKVAGIPVSQHFDMEKQVFTLVFTNSEWIPEDMDRATEIYLPRFHFGSSPTGFTVEISDGHFSFKPELQALIYMHNDLAVQHKVVVRRK